MSGKDKKTDDKKSDKSSTQTDTSGKSLIDDNTAKFGTAGVETLGTGLKAGFDYATEREKRKQEELRLKKAEQDRLAAEAAANAVIEKANRDKDIAIDTNQKNLERTEKEEATKQRGIESQEKTTLDKNEKDLKGIEVTAQAEVDKVTAETEVRKKESADKLEMERQRLEAEKQKHAAEMADRQAERESRDKAFLLTLQAQQANPTLGFYPNSAMITGGYPYALPPAPQPHMQYLPAPGYQPNYGAPGNFGYAPPSHFPYSNMGGMPMHSQQSANSFPMVTTAGGTPVTPLPGQQANFQHQMQMMNSQGAHLMSMQGQNPQAQMMGIQPQPGMVPYQGPPVVNPGSMPGGFFHHQAQAYSGNANNQPQPPQLGPTNS